MESNEKIGEIIDHEVREAIASYGCSFPPEFVRNIKSKVETHCKAREMEAVEKYIRKDYKRRSKMYGDKDVVDSVTENDLADIQQQEKDKDEKIETLEMELIMGLVYARKMYKEYVDIGSPGIFGSLTISGDITRAETLLKDKDASEHEYKKMIKELREIE